MNPLARDTVTLYMKHVDPTTRKDVWTRCVLHPVIWTQKTVRSMSDGTLRLARQTSITVDVDVLAVVGSVAATYIEPKAYAALTDVQRAALHYWTLDKGFAVVYGENANDIDSDYTIAMLKAESDSYATIQIIGDNTHRAALNHWQVEAV